MFLKTLLVVTPFNRERLTPTSSQCSCFYEHNNLLPRLRGTFASEAHPARARLQCQGELLVPLLFMRLQSVKRQCADFTRE